MAFSKDKSRWDDMTGLASVGDQRLIRSGEGATVALAQRDSGQICLFDRAAGIVYTLPAPQVGLYFDFYITTTITSNSAKVITNTTTVFLLGSLISMDVDTGNVLVGFTADGSTHRAVTQNGTTTGGIKGTFLRFTCITSTIWFVEGTVQGNGVVATPVATS